MQDKGTLFPIQSLPKMSTTPKSGNASKIMKIKLRTTERKSRS